jgi:intracellular septation protein A
MEFVYEVVRATVFMLVSGYMGYLLMYLNPKILQMGNRTGVLLVVSFLGAMSIFNDHEKMFHSLCSAIVFTVFIKMMNEAYKRKQVQEMPTKENLE